MVFLFGVEVSEVEAVVDDFESLCVFSDVVGLECAAWWEFAESDFSELYG